MILELKDNSNKALLIGDDFASVVLGSGCIDYDPAGAFVLTSMWWDDDFAA